MTPNLLQFKVKQNTGTFNSISKLMTSTNTPPLSQHNFWHCNFTAMGVQSYVHASVDSPTFKEGSAVMFGHVLDGVNEDLQRLVRHICQLLLLSWISHD